MGKNVVKRDFIVDTARLSFRSDDPFSSDRFGTKISQ